MNRLLLLFVLLFFSFGLRAAPFSTNKISPDINPINISISNGIGVDCDTMLVRITFTIDLPADQLKSAVMNFDDGRGDFFLDSAALSKTLTFDAHYGSVGSKHITFRLLKTDDQYEEKSIDFTMSEFRSTLDVGPTLIYADAPSTLLRAEGRWTSYLWSTGETTASIFAQTPGTYTVRASEACGRSKTDTIVIKRADPNGLCMFYLSVLSCDSVVYTFYDQSCEPGYYPVRWILSSMNKRDTLYGQSPSFKAKNSEFVRYEITFRSFSNGKQMMMAGVITPRFFPSTFATEQRALENAPIVLEGRFAASYNTNMIKLDTTEPVSYRWSTGAATPGITVAEPGLYVQECGFERCFDKFKTNRSYQVQRAILKPIITPDAIDKLSVTFTDSAQVSFYNQLNWSFGDGATATGREVTHTYSRAGTYNVQLTGISSSYPYNRDTKSIGVIVGVNDLEVELGPDVSICPGQTVYIKPTFQHNGGTYLWNTGDTSWDMHVTNPGQYIVVVTLGDRIGTDTINITNDCVVRARFYSYRLNNGQLTMQFVEMPVGDSARIGYRRWSFGDGNYSGDHNPTHTYAAPGIYNVLLRIFDAAGHAMDSTAQSINIMPPVKVQLGKDTTIAAGQSLTLDAAAAIGFWSGDATYLWSTGDTSRSITVNQAGLYSLTVQMYGYVSSDTIKVLQNPPPAEPNVSMSINRLGSSIHFWNTSTLSDVIKTTWYPGDGNSVVQVNGTPFVIYKYSQAGTYQVRMELLTSDSLIHMASQQVIIWPEFNAGNDTSYTGSPMLFKINEPYYSDSSATVTWYPGAIKAHQLLVTEPGEYTAYLKTPVFSSADTFRVYPPLNIDLGPDTTFTGAPINLRINAPYFGDPTVTCFWQPSGISGQQITVQSPGTYKVFASRFGSVSIDSIIVKAAPPKPRADFSYTRANDGAYTMNFTAIPVPGVTNVAYSWQLGDGNTATGQYVSHTYSQPGLYNVFLFTTDSLQHTDTIRRFVEIVPFVSVHLGADTTIAAGQSLHLDAIAAIGGIRRDSVKFLWSTGDTSSIITVNQAGLYSLTVRMNGYSSSDTIKVLLNPPPVESKVSMRYSNNGSDPKRVFFQNTSTLPNIVKTTWYTGDGNSIVRYPNDEYYVLYNYAQEGTYQVRMEVLTSDNGIYTASQQVIVWPAFNAGNDTSYTGSPMLFKINEPFYSDSSATVIWYPGAINGHQLLVTKPGEYSAYISTPNFSAADTFRVYPQLNINLGPDTTYYGTPLVLRINAPYYGDSTVTVRWMPGNNSGHQITVNAPGTYYATATQYGYSFTDTIIVRDGRPQLPADFIAVRANDGAYTMNFTAIPAPGMTNLTYLWKFGDGDIASGQYVSHTYSQPDLYNVALFTWDSLHRLDSIRRQITIVPFVAVNLGPDTILVPGSSISLDAIAAIGGTKPDEVRFLWSTGDTTSLIKVTQTGTYVLSVSMYGRTVRDTVVVSATPVPPVIDSSAAVIAVTDSIPVTYTFPHGFNPDNIFTVQLMQSDSATGGRSAEPEVININSFPGTDPRVSVNVKLPETIPCGKNYRIRVVSSSPADTSIWSQGFEVLNPPAVPVLTQRGDSLESTVGYAYQWFRNNQPVDGATTRAIRAKLNGSYRVQVFSAGDCSTISAPLSMVITGLTDQSLTISKLTIYPNPSAGAVYVEVEKVPAQPVRAEVYNSKGIIIHTFLIKDKKTVLDLSAQPRGLYYIVPRGADKRKATVVVIQ